MSRIKHLLLAALAWLALATPGFAQSSKLSALTASGAVVGTQLFYCATGGTSLSCTAAQNAAYNYSLMSNDCTASGTGTVICTKTNGNAFSGLATLLGTHAGDVAYWNGTAWAILPGNTTSTGYFSETSAGVPSWTSGTASVTVTTSCPSTSQTSSTINLATGTVTLSQSSSYTVLAADCRKLIYATGGPISLPVLSGLVANYGVGITNSNLTGGGNVTVQTTDSSAIVAGGVSATSVVLTPGESSYFAANVGQNGWIGTGFGPGTPTSGSGSTINGPGYSVGAFYPFIGPSTITASVAGSITVTYCGPGWLSNVSPTGSGSGTITSILIRVVAAGVTGTAPSGTMGVAIYSDQLASGVHRPNTVIANTAAFSTTTAGVLGPSLVSSVSLTGNTLYWICAQPGDTTVTYSAPIGGAWWGALVGGAGTNNIFNNTQYTNNIRAASTFGTWPGPTATWTETGANSAPYVAFSFSSIP